MAHTRLRHRADGRGAYLAGYRPQAARLQCRNGLILALLSLWLIRRRSLAALTVSRHIEFDTAGCQPASPSETPRQARRELSCAGGGAASLGLLHYLNEIRPRLLRRRQHDGLWAW